MMILIKVSGNDQEMPQSHTADQSVAPSIHLMVVIVMQIMMTLTL